MAIRFEETTRNHLLEIPTYTMQQIPYKQYKYCVHFKFKNIKIEAYINKIAKVLFSRLEP